MYIEADRLIIENLGDLSIPYTKIKNLENMDENRITKTRVLMIGFIVGLLWKKNFLYTVIEFHDGLTDQSIVLDLGKDAEPVQRLIYERMANAKGKLA